MNANPKFLNATASVDEAAVKPLPNSRKVYVEGSRPDIRVPMREITQSDTPASFGAEKNPPIYVYDTSGPYTDPAVQDRHPLGAGPAACRNGSRNATTPEPSTDRARATGASALPTRSSRSCASISSARRAARKAGMNVTQMHYARRGIDHARDGIHRDPRESAARRAAPSWSRASTAASRSARRSRR